MDRVDEFFDELSRRGHDPLLDRLEGTGRFEGCGGGQVEQWLGAGKGGYVNGTRGGGNADWVMRAERSDFARLINGEVGTLSAFIRGTLQLTIQGKGQRIGLISRVFAGAPEARR